MNSFFGFTQTSEGNWRKYKTENENTHGKHRALVLTNLILVLNALTHEKCIANAALC